MRFLPENGKLKRVRVKKAEEGGSVERLKASLEKGKLLCGLGSGPAAQTPRGVRCSTRGLLRAALFASKRARVSALSGLCLRNFDAKRRGFGLKRAMFTQFRCSKTRVWA